MSTNRSVRSVAKAVGMGGHWGLSLTLWDALCYAGRPYKKKKDNELFCSRHNATRHATGRERVTIKKVVYL